MGKPKTLEEIESVIKQAMEVLHPEGAASEDAITLVMEFAGLMEVLQEVNGISDDLLLDTCLGFCVGAAFKRGEGREEMIVKVNLLFDQGPDVLRALCEVDGDADN